MIFLVCMRCPRTKDNEMPALPIGKRCNIVQGLLPHQCYSHQNAIALSQPLDLQPPWQGAWGSLRTSFPVAGALLTYIPHCRRARGAILTHLCYRSSSCQGKCKSNDGEEGKRGKLQAVSLLTPHQEWLNGKEKEKGTHLVSGRSGWLLGVGAPALTWGKALETVSQ